MVLVLTSRRILFLIQIVNKFIQDKKNSVVDEFSSFQTGLESLTPTKQ